VYHTNPRFLYVCFMRSCLFLSCFLAATLASLSLLFLFADPLDSTSLNLDGLTLSNEGLTLNLEAEPETAAVLEHCLIVRVLADREIQFAYFSERMSRAWKPGKRVTITKSVADRYLFQFHHKVDAARVLDEGPWLYDNFHIAMDRISPGAVSSAVPLNHIEFWVQVHGLPFGFIQPKVGQGIRSFLGTLKAYDSRNTIHSSYMRLKVSIDVTAPLKKEWRVRARNGEFVSVVFKYEKLGVFCHRCGVIGHTDKVCPELFELDSDDGVRNWGPFLKPASHRVGTAGFKTLYLLPYHNTITVLLLVVTQMVKEQAIRPYGCFPNATHCYEA